MPKYVFISNSSKPGSEEYESLHDIQLTNFNRPCLSVAKEMGYEIILGVNRKYPEKLKCSEMEISFYNSHTFRNIFAFRDNFYAYKNLCDILKKGDVEVIHCNTPIGGFIGRICGKKYKIPEVIYTAHGFHFYKGAPLFNNTIIKFVEYFLARWTDVIITMNQEDFQNAKKMKLRHNGRVYKINGVGINTNQYQNIKIDKNEKRGELGLNTNDFVCIGVGDLIKRKNYQMAIKGIAKCNNKKIHYLICGVGPELDNLKKLSKKLGVENQIHFLGYREDIQELLAISNCFLFTSLQEGLPRSLMEAMSIGLPCLVSDIRGNRDLIKNVQCLIHNSDDCSKKIQDLIYNAKSQNKLSIENQKIIKKYDIKVVEDQIRHLYYKELKYIEQKD